MATVHGKGVVVSIDGKAMTSYANKLSYERTTAVHKNTTFGKNSETYKEGLKDGTASMSGFYDNTASTGPRAVLEALIGQPAVDFVYRPEGTGTGKPTSTVKVIVTKYTQDAAVDDLINWAADLQFSDDITDSTQ